MSYTLIEDEGVVLRNSDGVQVAPCQSADDRGFQDYLQWVDEGNQAIVLASRTQDARLAQQQRELAKAVRQDNVSRIKVTVSSGKVFDGDETSQGRMARAIVGMQAVGALTITWVLADNTPAQVTLQDLMEALVLSGQEQARLWVIP